jgi:type III secretion protein T
MEILLTWGFAIFLCAPRLLGMHIALPMFSDSAVPHRVRSGLSLALAIFMLPVILAQGKPPESPWILGGLALKEVFIGYAIGFPAALLNYAAQSAGDLVSFQSGASMSTFFDKSVNEEVTPMGNILRRYAEVLFFVSGAYAALLAVLFKSYSLWPVTTFIPELRTQGLDFFVSALNHYFTATCLLAFPALTCMFLITFCMGLIGRFLPQLNVFFVAMPLQCLSACLIMAVSFPVYAAVFKGHFTVIEGGMNILSKVFGSH